MRVGNLPRRICERDIRKLFHKLGRIRFEGRRANGMGCCATEFNSAAVPHAWFRQMAVVENEAIRGRSQWQFRMPTQYNQGSRGSRSPATRSKLAARISVPAQSHTRCEVL